MLVIFRRLKTEQREPESVLSAGFAMTTTGIATGLGENRHDLVGKLIGVTVLDFSTLTVSGLSCLRGLSQ